MKRIACFLLVALMLVAGSASAGEKDYAAMLEQQKAEGLLHLWDIPFGITIDEFMELAPEATGFPFEIMYEYEKPTRCRSYSESIDDAGPQLLDYHLLGAVAEFPWRAGENDNRLLDSIAVLWNIEEITDQQVLVDMYFDVLMKLTEKFGNYTQCSFTVSALNSEGKRELIECQLMNEDGTINTKDIVSALHNEEKSSVEFTWKNISLYMTISSNLRAMILNMSDRINTSEKQVTPIPYSEIATKGR